MLVHRTHKGGLQIIDPHHSFDKKIMMEIAEEMGLGNAVIQIGEKINIDQFIDALSRSRTYLPMVAVVTKIDENKKLKRRRNYLYKCSERYWN